MYPAGDRSRENPSPEGLVPPEGITKVEPPGDRSRENLSPGGLVPFEGIAKVDSPGDRSRENLSACFFFPLEGIPKVDPLRRQVRKNLSRGGWFPWKEVQELNLRYVLGLSLKAADVFQRLAILVFSKPVGIHGTPSYYFRTIMDY